MSKSEKTKQNKKKTGTCWELLQQHTDAELPRMEGILGWVRGGGTDTAPQGRAGNAHGRASHQEHGPGVNPSQSLQFLLLHHLAFCFYPMAGNIPCPKAAQAVRGGLALPEEPALSPSRPPSLPTAAPNLAHRAGSRALQNLSIPPASEFGQPRLSTRPHYIPFADPLPAAPAPYPLSQLSITSRCALEHIHHKGTASSPRPPGSSPEGCCGQGLAHHTAR